MPNKHWSALDCRVTCDPPRYMRTSWFSCRLLVSVGIVLTLTVSLGVVHLCQKPVVQPARITVRFLAMTNDLNGQTLATFTLSNNGHLPIQVADPFVELLHKETMIGGGIFLRTRLSPRGRPLTAEVTVPRNPDQWRVTFYYYPIELRHRLGELLVHLPANWGKRWRYPQFGLSTVHSDWMEPISELDWRSTDWLDPEAPFDVPGTVR